MSLSEVTYIYDAGNKFRAPGLAPLTASAVIGVLPLDKLVAQRPNSQRNRLGAEAYDIVIVVSAIKTSVGDETYTLTAKTGATGVSANAVGSLALKSTGQYVLKLNAKSIMHAEAIYAELKLDFVAAGTLPSVTFCAWLVLGDC